MKNYFERIFLALFINFVELPEKIPGRLDSSNSSADISPRAYLRCRITRESTSLSLEFFLLMIAAMIQMTSIRRNNPAMIIHQIDPFVVFV